jgi:hypothetical protein
MTLVPGKVLARVVEHNVLQSQSGHPQVAVSFKTVETGEPITWFGSFHPNAKSFTVSNLILLGFQGTSLEELGGDKLVLNNDVDYELVLKLDEYNGTSKLKVQFINMPGASTFKNKVEGDELKTLSSNVGLQADFIQARKNAKPLEVPGLKQDDSEELPY